MDPAVTTDLIQELHQMNARISHLEGVIDTIHKAKSFYNRVTGHGDPTTSAVSHALEAFDKNVEVNVNTFTLPTLGATVVWDKPAKFSITMDGKTYQATGLDDLTQQMKALTKVLKPMKVPADMRALTTAVLRQQARLA